MTFTLPSDLDPGPGPPTPVPSSPPDFLSQLTAPKQADTRGRQLRDLEFIGSPPASGRALRSGQPLSKPNFSDVERVVSVRASAAGPGPEFC